MIGGAKQSVSSNMGAKLREFDVPALPSKDCIMYRAELIFAHLEGNIGFLPASTKPAVGLSTTSSWPSPKEMTPISAIAPIAWKGPY